MLRIPFSLSASLLLASVLSPGCTASETALSTESGTSPPAEKTELVMTEASPSEMDSAGGALGKTESSVPMTDSSESTAQLATFGAGCYWCVEAVYDQIEGVQSVRSGFMGGDVDNPSYAQICTGTTGHAEVCELTFDPSVVTYEELLDWFWRLHDPTTLNRQGADAGTQYRSHIFFHSEEQREQAIASKEAAAGAFSDPIVTKITAASTFYPGPDYHQDYYFQNQSKGYCEVVIRPKLKKLNLDY